MSRRRTFLALLVPLLLAAPRAGVTHAASPAPSAPRSPSDFAYGAPVETDGDRPIQAVELPARIYRSVTRSDLGDLRVFNAEGEMVPHAVDRLPRDVSRPAPRSVPFFPLREAAGSGRADRVGDPELTVSVRSGASGALIEVREPPGADRTSEGTSEGTVRGVLLDLTGLDLDATAGIDEIVLDLAEESEFLTEITVESGDDLTRWRPWGHGTVARLRYGGNTLSRHALDLPPRRPRYARLVWPRNSAPPSLERVRVAVAHGVTPGMRWESLDGTSPEEHVFVFDQGGVLPVERGRLGLPQVNTLARVTLSSAAAPAGPWRRRASGLVYRLRHDGRELSAPALEWPAVTDRYWRLEVDPAGGGLGRRPPTLELGWRPERLLFVARGAPPFTLAFGSATARPAGLAPGALLDPEGTGPNAERPRVARARLGEVTELGGTERLVTRPKPPWSKILLWAVLVVAVLGLGWMVVGLLREADRAG